MKMKMFLTVGLLLFVAVAVTVLVMKETQSKPANADPGPVTAVESSVKGGDEPADEKAVEPAEHHYIVHYFYTTFRCPSCNKIEKWTHEAVNTSFKDEVEDGVVVWSMLNTDEDENKHFIKDYELVTKQVILVEMDKGKQVKWLNLPEVWNLLGDEGKFKKYIADELTAFMNDETAEGSSTADGEDS